MTCSGSSCRQGREACTDGCQSARVIAEDGLTVRDTDCYEFELRDVAIAIVVVVLCCFAQLGIFL